jgi:hypothetical protein
MVLALLPHVVHSPGGLSHEPGEGVRLVIRRQESRVRRHPYEWPVLPENPWPNHGRKLTLSWSRLFAVVFCVSWAGCALPSSSIRGFF